MIDQTVPIKWKRLSSRKIGSTRAELGMIIVMSVTVSSSLRPRKFVIASA
jgi:hypothetical protein